MPQRLERERRERLLAVVAALDDFYGRPVWEPRYPPVDELVYTVLSQNTADVNTERTFAALKRRFPTWVAVREADVGDVEDAIALGGLAHTKAPRIQRILAAISERGGAPDLERARRDERRGGCRLARAPAGGGPQDGRLRAHVRARAGR